MYHLPPHRAAVFRSRLPRRRWASDSETPVDRPRTSGGAAAAALKIRVYTTGFPLNGQIRPPSGHPPAPDPVSQRLVNRTVYARTHNIVLCMEMLH